MDQKLSKDMKKQGHVKSRKPRNRKLSSEKSLAESPKKGRFTEPSSKKLDGEKFLTKSKLTHLKEFNQFLIKEEIELIEGDGLKQQIYGLIETDPKAVQNFIESGQLDPEMEHNMILRRAIRNKKNELVKYIITKIDPKNHRMGSIIGSCYEFENREAAEIIMNHIKISNKDIEDAIKWISKSPRYDHITSHRGNYQITPDESGKQKDIDDLKSKLSRLSE